MTENDALKEVRGNRAAFLDCFVANSLFLLTFPLLTIPEIPGFLPISSPRGSQLIANWAACVPSFVVVVADMETFQTNDSFLTWTRIRVPPNILTEDERHNVSDEDQETLMPKTKNMVSHKKPEMCLVLETY